MKGRTGGAGKGDSRHRERGREEDLGAPEVTGEGDDGVAHAKRKGEVCGAPQKAVGGGTARGEEGRESELESGGPNGAPTINVAADDDERVGEGAHEDDQGQG